MTSCSVDETLDKVIIHYLDGRTYTYKNYVVDCFVDWKENKLDLVKYAEDGSVSDMHRAYLTVDTMAIESRHSESVTIWKNPKYNLSVKIDIMTAKQRAKKNQVRTSMKWLISSIICFSGEESSRVTALKVRNWLYQIGVFK